MYVIDEAKMLYQQNSKGWLNAKEWDDLHEDTQQIWIDFAKRRLGIN